LQPEQDGKKQTVWDIAFKPDGSLMVAAIGKRLVVFDPNDGTILKTKQAHGNDIYTVSCSRDGLYIASGASDKTVSVWTWELSQKYTYTHADSIQALAFNPVMHNVLASCSSVDFAIWTVCPPGSSRPIDAMTGDPRRSVSPPLHDRCPRRPCARCAWRARYSALRGRRMGSTSRWAC